MAQRSSLPNIVLIVADDLGYGDLSCYGATKIATPNIDRLASGGVRFKNAYVTSSLCSPSRYGILTGRYSWRTHLKTGVLKSFSPPLIEASRTTLASLLKRKNYYTACVGKWHLGFRWALKEDAPDDAATSVLDSWGHETQQHIDFSKPVTDGPLQRGFDYFFGIAGSNNMIPFVFVENERVLSPPSVPDIIWPNTLRAPEWDQRSLDEQLSRKAVTVIDDHFSQRDGRPLFLYFPTSAIHAPCRPDATRGMSQAGLRGDMVVAFDRMVGDVVTALRRNGVLDNTLIFVVSDNGPLPGDPYPQMQPSNEGVSGSVDTNSSADDKVAPAFPGFFGRKDGWVMYDHDPVAGLLGFKSDAWEGGLRVPFIVHWPEVIAHPRVASELICTTDLLATFADITGEALTDKEGEDSYSFLRPLLHPGSEWPRKSVTLVAGRTGALTVRQGQWKYIEAADIPERREPTAYPPPPNEFPGAAGVDEVQLYNLSNDPGERTNLADTNLSKRRELQRVLRKVVKGTKTEGGYDD